MNKSELKQAVQSTGSYFFDRSSMRFFGDTMRNYYVPAGTARIVTSLGNEHECYELQRVHPVKHGMSESAYFDCLSFQRVLPSKGVQS